MPQFGEVRVDFVTFTTGVSPSEANVTASISGLIKNPTFSGDVIVKNNLDVEGNITISGTVTGNAAGFTSVTGTTVTGTTANFTSGVFTTQISGATITGDAGQFNTLTGNAAGFTSITGTTITGTTANFVTVSGTTVTGNTGNFTTATTTTANVTSGIFASGTAAAPSVSVGTTDNGIYSPGADQLALATNGAQRLLIEADGDINIDSGGVFYDAANKRLGVGAAIPGRILHIDSGSVSNAYVRFTNTNSTVNGAEIGLFDDGSAGPALVLNNSMSDGVMVLNTNSTERLRITSDGKVGVGTSSPGSFQAGANNLVVGTGSGDNGISIFAGASNEGRLYFARTGELVRGQVKYDFSADKMYFAVDSATKATLTSTGLGIGTTSPNEKLDVRGKLYLNNGSASYFDAASSNGLVITNPTAVRWEVNSSERARIDSSGRLLVGTSTARTSFHNGTGQSSTVQFEATHASPGTQGRFVLSNNTTGAQSFEQIFVKSGAATAGSHTLVADDDRLGLISFQGTDGSEPIAAVSIEAYVDGTPGANDMPGRLVLATTADGASSPTERMRISQDGKLNVPGVYNATTADAANIRVTAAGDIVRSTSSIKYKTDIETLENTFADAILNCRPVWFRSLSATDNPSWGYWGFIAEEVAEIDPRLVSWKTTETTYDENGSTVQTACDPEPEGVQYDRFVPHLLNLIKRQKEQIEALEARVTALEP